MWNITYFCSDLKTTIRHIALTTALFLALSAKAQETLVPDSTLHLPELNSLGQMHAISRWPVGYGLMGYQNWDLHKGMNLSLGASVFAGFGKYAPSGAGFAQNASGMYAWPINDKLSFAAGVYLLNATWGGFNLRDTGLSGVLSYRFNERWEGYLYGQKSLIRPKLPYYFYDAHELGDRIGAAVKYNVTPSFYIQLSVEERRLP